MSALDARHRVALSGYYLLPFKVNLSGTLVLSSARPFNISVGSGGNDRNLDDVNTDRPNFSGKLGTIDWRHSDEALRAELANAFSLPTIGTVGNLPRNAGRGPATHSLNLRLTREFKFAERRRAEFQIEAFNPREHSVFSPSPLSGEVGTGTARREGVGKPSVPEDVFSILVPQA